MSKACHILLMDFGAYKWLLLGLGDGLSQFTPQNFSRGGFWNGIDEVYFTRLLVMGKPVGDEGAKLFSQPVALNKSFA